MRSTRIAFRMYIISFQRRLQVNQPVSFKRNVCALYIKKSSFSFLNNVALLGHVVQWRLWETKKYIIIKSPQKQISFRHLLHICIGFDHEYFLSFLDICFQKVHWVIKIHCLRWSLTTVFCIKFNEASESISRTNGYVKNPDNRLIEINSTLDPGKNDDYDLWSIWQQTS